MKIVLDSSGNVELFRGEHVTRGQHRSKYVHVCWREGEDPVSRGEISAVNLMVNICITRPDGEQSGWYQMVKVAGTVQEFKYFLQAWDTCVSGEASISIRWYDASLEDGEQSFNSVGPIIFIVSNGVIAQPVPLDTETKDLIVHEFRKDVERLDNVSTGLQDNVKALIENKLDNCPNGTTPLINNEGIVNDEYLKKLTAEDVNAIPNPQDMTTAGSTRAYVRQTNSLATGFVNCTPFVEGGGNLIYRDAGNSADQKRSAGSAKILIVPDESEFANDMDIVNRQYIKNKISTDLGREETKTVSQKRITDEFVSMQAHIDNGDKEVRDYVDQSFGTPMSTPLLDENNKINSTYLPDTILGQMVFGGTFSQAEYIDTDIHILFSDNGIKVLKLLGAADQGFTEHPCGTWVGSFKPEGLYFICSHPAKFYDYYDNKEISFQVGDWLVYVGSGRGWQKIDNTDAVQSVNGKTGAVKLTAGDVGAVGSINGKLKPDKTGNLEIRAIDIDGIPLPESIADSGDIRAYTRRVNSDKTGLVSCSPFSVGGTLIYRDAGNSADQKRSAGSAKIETVADASEFAHDKDIVNRQYIRTKLAGIVEGNYKLLKKIVIGYSLLTSKPDDWETNYSSYYYDSQTDESLKGRLPVYTNITGNSAPAWPSGTNTLYYKFDSTTVPKQTYLRGLSLKKVLVYFNLAGKNYTGPELTSSQKNLYLAISGDYNSGSQVHLPNNVLLDKNISSEANPGFIKAELENGHVFLQYIEFEGVAKLATYPLPVKSIRVGSIIYASNNWWEKDDVGTKITDIMIPTLYPGTEVFIKGVTI